MANFDHQQTKLKIIWLNFKKFTINLNKTMIIL